jgi:hypothetical protein
MRKSLLLILTMVKDLLYTNTDGVVRDYLEQIQDLLETILETE